ncbi:MAG TPA: hypothetical protein VKT77_10200 [Chthonomonadaceae bacterium]|nr:hypothetical protein [Chthonomonadaceae bacterium]
MSTVPQDPIIRTRREETPVPGNVSYLDAIKKLPPWLNPTKRYYITWLLKWLFLLGLLMIIAWIPSNWWAEWSHMRQIGNDAVAKSKPVPLPYFYAENTFNCPLQICVTVFAALLATSVPRLLLPRGWFERWTDASEGFRDWIVVGLIAGVPYAMYIYVMKLRDIHWDPKPGADWLTWRGVPAVLCGVMAFALTSAFRRKENKGLCPLPVQWLIQAVLILLAFSPINTVLDRYSQLGIVPAIVAIAGAIFCLTIFVALIIAYTQDSRVVELQQHGVRAGSGPANMTITVIGGRSAGKTTFLAGAYWQWEMEKDLMGPFVIEPLYSQAVVPAVERAGDWSQPQIDYDLRTVAENLYQDRKLPAGNVSCQDLPFELRLRGKNAAKQHTVARFSVLDYPGGAVTGIAANEAIQYFQNHIRNTDGLLLIADMSYARRGLKDADFLAVMQAYNAIMDLVLDCNGSNRVVPVALVLTKIDEFFNEQTNSYDTRAMEACLSDAGYGRLESYWKKQCQQVGASPVIWSQFYTTALTYTHPADNDPARRLPYVMSDPPPALRPSGCSTPLLWLTREMLRWNVTLATSLTTFLLGSSARYRRQVQAIDELETVIARMMEAAG